MSLNSNEFLSKIKDEDKAVFKIAVITKVESSELYLKFYGEESESQKTYKFLDNYSPVKGDVVCVARINESWLVLGKISEKYDEEKYNPPQEIPEVPEHACKPFHYIENDASGSPFSVLLMYYTDSDNEHVLRPSKGGKMDLGTSSYKIRNIYATNGTIQTSDYREKEDIEMMDARYLNLFQKLIPKSFKYVEGTSGRKHIGFISQEVENAMKECGISDFEFAGFIKSPVYEVIDGKETDHVIDYIYGLRYEEFVGLLTYALQDIMNFLVSFGYKGGRNECIQ